MEKCNYSQSLNNNEIKLITNELKYDLKRDMEIYMKELKAHIKMEMEYTAQKTAFEITDKLWLVAFYGVLCTVAIVTALLIH